MCNALFYAALASNSFRFDKHSTSYPLHARRNARWLIRSCKLLRYRCRILIKTGMGPTLLYKLCSVKLNEVKAINEFNQVSPMLLLHCNETEVPRPTVE